MRSPGCTGVKSGFMYLGLGKGLMSEANLKPKRVVSLGLLLGHPNMRGCKNQLADAEALEP